MNESDAREITSITSTNIPVIEKPQRLPERSRDRFRSIIRSYLEFYKC